MAPSDGLRRLAADLAHAAVAIQDEAAGAISDAATAVETRAHALDVGTGVVIVRPAPNTAVVSSTTPLGLYVAGGRAPVVPADTAGIAGELTGELLVDGVRLIVGGHR